MLKHDDELLSARERMVSEQLEQRGIANARVLQSMREVERHRFVLPQDHDIAYEDYPLPIGYGQTISQPYIVAFMIEQLDIRPTDTVLEIGTGSGYAAAVMARLAKKVYTIEMIAELYERAKKTVSALHVTNVECHLSDGYKGLQERAPFDRIILSASPERIPQTLLDQLAIGGKLIAPVGSIKLFQQLTLVEKKGRDQYSEKELMGVNFVEMVRDDEFA